MEENSSSQKSQNKPGGNTKTPGTRNQLYRWVFTLKSDLIQISQLFEILKEICKKFTFSLEKGESGYEHYQGVISLKTKEYFNTVKNLIHDQVHLEPCRDWIASIKYCSKSDTHIDGPWNENSTFIKIIKELRPWQKKLEQQLLEKPDDRTIIWVFDKKGGAGKTQFIKYMYLKYKVCVLESCAKKDMAFAIDNPKIVLINLTRTVEESVNYGAIESLKDGLIFSSKYESKLKIFDSPHVVIFSNFEPDYDTMSKDRWKVLIL